MPQSDPATEGTTTPPLTVEQVARIRGYADYAARYHVIYPAYSNADVINLCDEVDSLRSQLASMTLGLSEQEADAMVSEFYRAAIEWWDSDISDHSDERKHYETVRAALRAALVRTKP